MECLKITSPTCAAGLSGKSCYHPVCPTSCSKNRRGPDDTYSQECFVYDVYSGHRVIFGSDWCWSNFLFFFFFFSEWLRGCFHFYTTHILHPQTLSACAVWSHVIETTLLLCWHCVRYILVALMKWFPHQIVPPIRLPGQTVSCLFVLPSDVDRGCMYKVSSNCYHPILIDFEVSAWLCSASQEKFHLLNISTRTQK